MPGIGAFMLEVKDSNLVVKKMIQKFKREKTIQWKGIDCKQSTRWQHLSRLKDSAFFPLQIFLVVKKHSNLYLGLVLPSGG